MGSPQFEAVARLFGTLLLQELDRDAHEQISATGSILAEVGIDLPQGVDLDELAACYFECFVNPTSGYPLVESLYQGGTYEGDAAASVRRIAEAAGLELDTSAARGAPTDHLGALLTLWAEMSQRDGEAAREFALAHLSWALPVLARCSQGQPADAFYGSVCRACGEFVEVLLDDARQDAGREPREEARQSIHDRSSAR